MIQAIAPSAVARSVLASVLTAAALCFGACGSEATPNGFGDASVDASALSCEPGGPDLQVLYERYFSDAPTDGGGCVFAGCHLDVAPIFDSAQGFFDVMVNRPSPSDPSGVLVLPGQPANSALMARLEGDSAGLQMPLGGPFLSPQQVAEVSAWICDGALAPGARRPPPDAGATDVDCAADPTCADDPCDSCPEPPECDNDSCECQPLSCAEAGFDCGSVSDGCGGSLDCGECSAPLTCGGGGTPNVCGCTPTSCEAQGATCGEIGDGCGGTLSCGTCASPLVCGGGGTPNQCGCEGGACACATPAGLSADVQPIFTNSCAKNGCHNGFMPSAGINLSAGNSHGELVNVASSCGTPLVTPGDPDASYLINKVRGVGMCSGSRMPKKKPLPEDQITTIIDWICGGALDN